MKKNIYKILFLSFAILWMGIIFYFSHQNGESSSMMSGKITNWIIHLFVPSFDNLSSAEQNELSMNISFVVRKLAHYLEYAILGLFLYLAVSKFTNKQSLQCIIVVLCGVLYAISDELHQSFIGGRTPMIRDVLIDSLGLLTMMLCICIVINIKKIKKKR